MTKENLIQVIIKKTGFSKRQSSEVLNVILEEISKTLSKGEKIVLTGFGTFEVRQRAAREGRNPKTGEKIQIPAAKILKFKPGRTLKEAVK
jgi:DNA-binding protein HU-beta